MLDEARNPWGRVWVISQANTAEVCDICALMLNEVLAVRMGVSLVEQCPRLATSAHPCKTMRRRRRAAAKQKELRCSQQYHAGLGVVRSLYRDMSRGLCFMRKTELRVAVPCGQTRHPRSSIGGGDTCAGLASLNRSQILLHRTGGYQRTGLSVADCRLL